MKFFITSVKDELSGFKTFNLDEKIEVAKRNFKDTCKTSEIMKLHLGDYSLWSLGTYDNETGVIEPELVLLLKGEEVI